MRLLPLAAAGLIACAPVSALAAGHACRTVHGRMVMANGAPAVRILVSGSGRTLGVVQPHERFDDLPESIRSLWSANGDEAMWASEVVGDFRVCDVTASRPGRMQMVSLKDGRRLSMRPRR